MIETAVERLIFMSRWIMAPIYLGLVLVLGVLMVKFMEELYHFVPHVLDLRETDVILMTLTLLDISLADEDGLKLLEQLKKNQPSLRVIMLTGMGFVEDLLQEAQQKGADGYVSKVLPLDELLLAIQRILKS